MTDLAAFVATMGGERSLRVEESLGSGFVRLRVDEAERRQAKHDIRSVEDAVVELLRNSRDAGASHIYVATAREESTRTLVVLDDGGGIPRELHERVFDARVTSKLDTMHMDRWGIHGRGMALYSVRENALEAGIASSEEGKGCSLRVRFDLDELAERADQSSWPRLGTDDEGLPNVVRGPHNIIRTCCEFALEERGRCEVYLGSPAEIVATARMRSRLGRDAATHLDIGDLSQLPVLNRLYAAVDAEELCEVALDLGIDISERTCHRIVSGQIRPLRSVYSQLAHAASAQRGDGEIDLMRDRRARRLSQEDAEEFARIMERDFSYIAERYYLRLSSAPMVRFARGKLVVSFEVSEED